MSDDTATLPQSKRTYAEAMREFVQRFRELNPHLPEVQDALRAEAFRTSPPIFEYVPPVEEPETEFPDLYFIGSAGGPIKIGISVDPTKRLRQLQTSHPHKLTILAVVPGGAMLEPDYHERFAEHRLEGEWFEPHADILNEVERLGRAVIDKAG